MQDPTAKPHSASLSAHRSILAVLAVGGLLFVAGVAWALAGAATRPPAAPAPAQVQTLYYQGVDGALLALDVTTGVTRTLVPRQAQYTRLLDVSPDGQRVAFMQSTRPITATVWYAPVTETVRIRVQGEAPRTVPIRDPLVVPESATFLADETLVVVGRTDRRLLAQIYLYDAAGGTSRLLAEQVETHFALPDQGLLLYTQTLEGPEDNQPFGNPRRMALQALDVGGALAPRTLATWALGQAGWPVAVWPDPAHNVVYFTTLQPGEQDNPYWSDLWNPIALHALPVRPLGTPRPVATFASESFPPVLRFSDSGRYLHWYLARATPLPSTPRGMAFANPSPPPQRFGELRWDNGQGPALVEAPLPLDLTRGGGFIPGSDQVIGLPSAPPAPPTATPAASPPRGGVRFTPTATPPPALTLQIYDPAQRRVRMIVVGTASTWLLVRNGPAVGGVRALGDRLLVAGPAWMAGGTPPVAAAAEPLQLLLGRLEGDVWRFSSLGELGMVGAGRTLELDFYGVTPDGAAVVFGAAGVPRNGAVAAPGTLVTTLYRARLDGGGLQPLGLAAQNAPVLARAK
jgi:hypothetical protein